MVFLMKHQKPSWIGLLFILSLGLKAQNYDHLFDLKLPHKSLTVGLSAYQELASNGLTSDFFKEYISGGYIEEVYKDKAIAHLKEDNRAVVRYGGGAFAKLGLKERSFRLTFNVDYHSFNELIFNKDIFVLYFKGNKRFEGNQAQLKPFGIERTDYTAFKLGFEKDFKAVKMAFKIGMSSGLDYFSLNVDKGSLFTANEGRYVDLQMKLKSYSSDGSSPVIWNNNSLGFVADAALSVDVTKTLSVAFHVKNFGFLDWSDLITERIVDTLYRYNGLEIDNLLDSFSISVKDVEDIESDFVRSTKGLSRRSDLPSEFVASLGLNLLNNNLHVNLGCGILKAEFARTIYFVNSQYLISSFLAGGVLIKRNAYADWDLGLHVSMSLAKTLGLQLYWESLSFIGASDRSLHLTGGASVRLTL